MNINLQIDRLILENINLSPRERRQLQGAIETELALLLTTNGLPPHLQKGGAIPTLSTNLTITQSIDPAQMARQIAQDIYEGLIRRI
jgi:hypothetical protein